MMERAWGVILCDSSVITRGDVREKVVRKGAKGVNDVFKELQQDPPSTH